MAYTSRDDMNHDNQYAHSFTPSIAIVFFIHVSFSSTMHWMRQGVGYRTDIAKNRPKRNPTVWKK
eukprot:1930857-Ditylum_brightwellii.AAC.1